MLEKIEVYSLGRPQIRENGELCGWRRRWMEDVGRRGGGGM